jgi:hypothetical protein
MYQLVIGQLEQLKRSTHLSLSHIAFDEKQFVGNYHPELPSVKQGNPRHVLSNSVVIL